MITHDVPDADELDADAALWTIYDEAFPSEEREPREVIVGSLRDGAGVAARAREDGVTVGLATVHLLRDPPAVFLVYLGIRKDLRSRGLGAPLLEAVWRAGEERLAGEGTPPRGMVWECDMPSKATAPAEIEKRERRLRFFRRAGGVVLDQPYIQPPVDGVNPVPMHLLWRGDVPPADALALVRAVYYEKYGAANGIPRPVLDALYRRVLEGRV